MVKKASQRFHVLLKKTTAAEKKCGYLVKEMAKVPRHFEHVHGAEEAFLAAVLHRHPVLQRAQIIAQMQAARGLHAGQNAFGAGIGGRRVSHGNFR